MGLSHSTQPKILLIFSGGSISMRRNPQSGALESHYGPDQLLDLVPTSEIAHVDIEVMTHLDSTDLSPNDWEKLVDLIAKRYDEFDGFLITVGTNTLAYASSALSFATLGIGKPVVLTGSQIPAEEMHSDARNNLINALRVATMDLAGVLVVFGSKIVLGCRAKKLSESHLDAFGAFQTAVIGRIGAKTTLSPDVARRHGGRLQVRNGFEPSIVSLTLLPGMPVAQLQGALEHGARGLILRAFGSGDIPSHLRPALEEARENEIPVVVTTQCPQGATTMGLNDPGRLALETGVIQTYDMSMEAMSTKLMWLLKQKIPYSQIKDQMTTNLCGEISEPDSIFQPGGAP